MAGNNSVILVRVLGNTKGLTRSLAKAQSSLGGLDRISGSITSGMKLATIAAVAFGAAALGAGLTAGAALAAVPLALIGLLTFFAAQNARVKSAFTDLGDHVMGVMKRITAPLVPVLVRGAGFLQKAFDALVPSLKKIVAASAPLMNDFFKALPGIARELGPALVDMFKGAEPLLRSIGGALRRAMGGFGDMARALSANSGEITKFMDAVFDGLGKALPALGRIILALIPIGTTIITSVLPAIISLAESLVGVLGPAVQAVAGFFAKHPTVLKAVVGALVGLVVAVKVVQTAMALASAATLVFQGVAMAVRGAIILWKNAQFALNIAMALNPIGLVVVAIIALIAIFVIAWKKSETFRNIVTGAWEAIKRATGAVWGWIKSKISAVVKFLVKVFMNFSLPGLVIKHWSKIKAATGAAWNWVKSKVSGAANAVRRVVSSAFSRARSLVTSAWNAVKSATSRVWSSVVNVVRNFIGRLMNNVRGIKGKVTGAFSGAGRWLLNAGKNIIGGLIDGIGSMIDNVQSKLSGLTDMIPKWKGPIDRDKTLLKGAGELIIGGLITGLESKYGDVKRSLSGLTGDISKTAFTAPGVTIGARPAFAGGAAAGGLGGNTYQITVTAPVGSSSADIGREITRHIDAYERVGGRRRA